mmetsp:Transcript_13964/g.10071  ORF Transcript_13964/g.10071 Transcript_13964/m.10071 type:complete len:277 (+) Transcript_13964:235-1065(+)
MKNGVDSNYGSGIPFMNNRKGMKDNNSDWSDNKSMDDSIGHDQKNDIRISRNHLWLNFGLNVFFMLMSLLTFKLPWYSYPQSDRGVYTHDDDIHINYMFANYQEETQFIRQYVINGCPGLYESSDRDRECHYFMSFYRAFLFYTILKAIVYLLLIHSMLSTYSLIIQKQFYIPSPHAVENSPPTSQSKQISTRARVLQSFQDYLPTKTMWYAVLGNFAAIGQWLVLTLTFLDIQGLRVSVIIEGVYCLVLYLLRFHQRHWEKFLRKSHYLKYLLDT